MPTPLPPSVDFTGSGVTEAGFKTAITALRNYLSGLFGTDGVPATALAALGSMPLRAICDFRLSLTSGVPVTTADVLAAETLYCTPYGGNQIALYDGTNWNVRSSAQFSIDVPDVTGVHDVFCYDNAGVPTLEVLVWTNDTTRATALTTQDGVLVKTGALTRRYLGTFYSTTAGNGQIEDSYANRYLFNYYNDKVRPMRNATETADSWTYTTAALRQANANAANQLNFVIGVSENEVMAEVKAGAINDTGSGVATAGIGLDATNANATGVISGRGSMSSTVYLTNHASWRGFPGVGKHYLAWLEYSQALGTTSFIGDNGSPAQLQSGIYGELRG